MKFPRRSILGSLVLASALPLSAVGAEQDLQQKMDALSKELDVLKQQVTKTEQKSLGRWLTIGGDYRFRLDSLRGETKAFVDVNSTFANAQNQLQGNFFANPSPANAGALSG